MIEIIKNSLFYIALISGSIMVISLLIVATFRILCFLIDQLKIGKMMYEALYMYLKIKRPDLKIKQEDIVTKRGVVGIKRGDKNEQS